MSKRLAEEMCEIWSARTSIPTVVLRPVLILDDDTLAGVGTADIEFGAFVHVDDVATAVLSSLSADVPVHIRMTLCGPGPFDTQRAHQALGWEPKRTWTA